MSFNIIEILMGISTDKNKLCIDFNENKICNDVIFVL